MWVYGDIERVELAATIRASITGMLNACAHAEPGLSRHELLAQAFITTGELVQGLADQEFNERGADDLSAVQRTGAKLLFAQAQALITSWQSRFASRLPLPAEWCDWLLHLDSSEPLRIKQPEGYAHYALYPESYIEAARLSGLTPQTVVIGIRSIGTGLAALVAAALGTRPAYTLRPCGHPFNRHVILGDALSEEILTDPEADFAIVDEGPGLSGSSFGAVAAWLEENGVSRERLHFFPSHKGDLGPQASNAHRLRWKERPRHTIDFDSLLLTTLEPAHNLQTWARQTAGISAPSSWHDISGGNWRAIKYDASQDRPPSDMQMEKRKFLMKGGGQAWLVKFAGIGSSGVEKSRRGSILAEAGFTPRVIGTCHGFIIQEWMDGSPLDDHPLTRARLVGDVARYLAFRARHLPAPGAGASIRELSEMAIFNGAEAAGQEAGDRLRRRIGSPERFGRRLRRVDTDNRLHSWEWLLSSDGHIIKTDALDHSSAHDLVGCQDIAWDIAGACVEFGFSDSERGVLSDLIGSQTDCDLGEDILGAFEACYLGFQIGLWTQAAGRAGSPEKERIEDHLKRYLVRLRSLLGE